MSFIEFIGDNIYGNFKIYFEIDSDGKMVPNWGKTIVKNDENEKADKIAIINNIETQCEKYLYQVHEEHNIFYMYSLNTQCKIRLTHRDLKQLATNGFIDYFFDKDLIACDEKNIYKFFIFDIKLNINCMTSFTTTLSYDDLQTCRSNETHVILGYGSKDVTYKYDNAIYTIIKINKKNLRNLMNGELDNTHITFINYNFLNMNFL